MRAIKAAVRIFITGQDNCRQCELSDQGNRGELAIFSAHSGLVTANLGSLIMSYGLVTIVWKGRALWGAAITAIMTGEAYEQKAHDGAAIGPISGYHDARASGVAKPAAKDNVASMQNVIELHRCSVREISTPKSSCI